MRIRLLTPEGVVDSDRLVDQYTELNAGPQDKHEGPISLEITMFDETSFDKVKEYIDLLRGKIPIIPKSSKTPKTNSSVNPYQEIYQAIKGKEFIEDVIEYLEEINFRFISGQLLAEKLESSKDEEIAALQKCLRPDFQYSLRVLKFAKDPGNDKFDYTLAVGIKFIGGVSKVVHVIFRGEEKAKLQRAWRKEGAVNMKKKKIPMVFPDFMTIEERKKWRYLQRKVETQKPLSPKEEKFHTRYKLDIKNINEGKGFNL